MSETEQALKRGLKTWRHIRARMNMYVSYQTQKALHDERVRDLLEQAQSREHPPIRFAVRLLVKLGLWLVETFANDDETHAQWQIWKPGKEIY